MVPDLSFVNLLGVLAVATSAPLFLGFFPKARVPAVVLEIVLGIVLGPDVLGWLTADTAVAVIALMGLAMLLFLAGLEIDARALRGRTLAVAASAYAASLGLGWVAGAGVSAAGWLDAPVLLAVTLSATSLGLVVAVLKDRRATESTLGQTVIASASVADFAAVLLLSLVFSRMGGSAGGRATGVVVFTAVVAAAIGALVIVGRSPSLGMVTRRLQDTTAQLRVRASLVLLLGFVVLAEKVGLESILGAFMAGAAVGFIDRDSSGHPHFRVKLDAVGYGFLIPVFFVASGLRLDVASLFQSPGAFVRVPVLLLLLLAVRGIPAVLFLPALGPRRAAVAALLQATSLPFIVTASQLGVELRVVPADTAAALVCAGLLSVLLFPPLALALGLEEPARVPRPESTPEERP